MALDKYLRDSAIRLLRTKWPAPYMLAEELYALLKGIEVDTSGPITVTVPGFDPITIPPFPEYSTNPINFIDPDFPEWDPNIPRVTIDPIEQTPIEPPVFPGWPPQEEDDQPVYGKRKEERQFWHRAIFPAEVSSHESGANYSLRVTPNGNLTTYSSPFTPTFEGDTPVEATVSARLVDVGADVEEGSWVYAYRVIEYLETKTFYLKDEAITSTETVLTVLQEEWLFVPGGSGGGGKVARVTEEISARSGTTPGTGKAILYELSNGVLTPMSQTSTEDPTQTEEVEATIYNMVSSSISAGEDKFVQLKKIDGEWWIDVEDCSSDEDEV